MIRSAGQFSNNNARVMQVQHTIPYAGAFWNEEILRLTSFGYAYFDAARPERVLDDMGLEVEYDVENLDDPIGFEELTEVTDEA
jgi:hypothetical protein